MAYIMIVASRQDREYIGVLANSLLNRGFDVWIDDIRVGYGDETWNPTVEALKKSAGVIVVMTPAGYQSEWVQRQVMVALKTCIAPVA